MQDNPLPVGKLPHRLLADILSSTPQIADDVVVGPGIGFDCAVVSMGDRYLVLKSDPITFVTDNLGWYLVQVNANDLATTGATPRWLLVTLLLPENATDAAYVKDLNSQILHACQQLGIAVVGGHTEITYGLPRPLAIGTLVGEVAPDELVTPAGMRSGDRIILTKGVPIEATAILAKEFSPSLRRALTAEELQRATNYLFDPGIGVLRDAQTALAAGRITAMHDPTEGGVSAALWEMAEAAEKTLHIDIDSILVPSLASKVCDIFAVDPLSAIASGALLLTVDNEDVDAVLAALAEQQIDAVVIGEVMEGPSSVWKQQAGKWVLLPRPERDAIALLFEQDSA